MKINSLLLDLQDEKLQEWFVYYEPDEGSGYEIPIIDIVKENDIFILVWSHDQTQKALTVKELKEKILTYPKSRLYTYSIRRNGKRVDFCEHGERIDFLEYVREDEDEKRLIIN